MLATLFFHARKNKACKNKTYIQYQGIDAIKIVDNHCLQLQTQITHITIPKYRCY